MLSFIVDKMLLAHVMGGGGGGQISHEGRSLV